jgi:NAD-dependent dihydropyrimidine dehydrogenase PreA subunit
MDVYETLREILDAHPSGAPKSKAFDEILRFLFTPEEAELAAHMSFTPTPAEDIASAAGIPVDEAEYLLEFMADKAVIFSCEKDGALLFGLLPTVPGLFEYPLMRGKGSPLHERLGNLWTKYRKDGLGESFAGNPTPMARVVPVGQAIDSTISIHPYEEVVTLIEKAEYIALAQCACRISVGACHAPREVCLFFDGPARFLVERRYAREINREEAQHVLNKAEEAGLVHTSSNSADKAGFICNCCPCCCIILTCRTRLKLEHGFATSGFQPQVNSNTCTGCGICADERCPMQAVEIRNSLAVVDINTSIGCGLCVSACPAGAMILVRRRESPDIPATRKDLGLKVLSEKGKLERFLQMNKGAHKKKMHK